MKFLKFCVLWVSVLSWSVVANAEDGTTTEIPTTENSLLAALEPLAVETSNDENNVVNTDDSNEDDRYKELDSWEPPEWLAKKYPYYLSGFDYEGRPIWISEWGKFDLRSVVESGPENQELMLKYARKAARLIHNITMLPSNPLHEANFILDFDGLNINQFASIQTVTFGIRVGREHRRLIEAGRVARIVIINANYLADTFIRLAKSVFGRLFEVIEVYGSNKAQWVPQLLRLFPQDQLPEWYGGTKGHKPVVIYGR